ncbi:MAG TPA: hypothetical protein VGK61_01610, partial [Planctomycetota bacterium]
MKLLTGVLLLHALALPAAAQTWTPKTPPPAAPGPGASSASLGGLIYLLRGGGTKDFLAYDPAAD